jgi:hypothetical protein
MKYNKMHGMNCIELVSKVPVHLSSHMYCNTHLVFAVTDIEWESLRNAETSHKTAVLLTVLKICLYVILLFFLYDNE